MKHCLEIVVCVVLWVGGVNVYGLSLGISGLDEVSTVDQSAETGGASSSGETSTGDTSLGGVEELVATGTVVQTGVPWKGTWNLVIESVADEDSGKGYASGTGTSMLTFTVGSKAAVTVSGTLASGQKVSVKTKLYVGGDAVTAWIPVSVDSKKVGSFSFIIQITTAGGLQIGSASVWNASSLKKPFVAQMESVTGGRSGSSDEGERMFSCSLEIDELPNEFELLDEVSPDGVAVTCTAKKWTAEKAGKVKLNKKTGEITASDENPAALKLKYSAKKGTFSGSFVVYGIKETNKGTYKLKKYAASVRGVVVGGCGYGTATIKGVGVFPCSVE